MNKTILLLLTFILVLTSFAYATGVCSLNKYEFNPGINSIFQCSCDSPTEENIDGYLVWRNNNGSILYSESINSGSCRTSNFGTQHTFIYSETNFTGNVTFSLNFDGTGTPIKWDDINDITFDDFIVIGSSVTDCIINPFIINTNITELPTVKLGLWGSLEIQVFDSINNFTLTHAYCTLNVYDSSTGDLEFKEPLRSYGVDHIETGAFGLGYFEHKFIDNDLLPNHLYNAMVYCYCLNDTNSDEVCYFGDGGLGAKADYKECTTDFLFTTGEDLRTPETNIYYIVFASVIIMIFAMLYGGFKSKNEHIKGLLTYISFGCIPLLLQLSKTILELNTGNPRTISIIWVFEWVSMIVFLFLLIFLFIQFMISVLEKLKNGKG